MVVSTRLVVKLAAVTVAVAFASTNVPVGFQATTVSILTDRLAAGDTNFLNESCNVLLATPLPIHRIDTLVFAVTSPMFCTTVDSAKVGRLSTNKLSFARIVSQAMYSSFSNKASGVFNELAFNGVTIVVSLVPSSTSVCVAILALPFTASVASGVGVHSSNVTQPPALVL